MNTQSKRIFELMQKPEQYLKEEEVLVYVCGNDWAALKSGEDELSLMSGTVKEEEMQPLYDMILAKSENKKGEAL